VTRAIESAQKRVELQNFQARKRLLEYDDVMNQQREVLYSLRLFALEGGEEPKAEAIRMIEAALDRFILETAAGSADEWDRKLISTALLRAFLISAADIENPDVVKDAESLRMLLHDAGRKAFEAKLATWTELGSRHAVDRLAEKVLAHLSLRVLDDKWKDHLFELDHLRSGIYYRSLGQKDPLVEYKREAFDMFVDLLHDIRSTFTETFFKHQLQVGAPPPGRGGAPPPGRIVQPARPVSETDLMVPGAAKRRIPQQAMQATHGESPAERKPATQQRSMPKVGRNDPCPCGSGKKYTKCHGA
jgi:preprotein translocase subunit SecA